MKKIAIYYKDHLKYALALMARLTKEMEKESPIKKTSIWGMGYTYFENGNLIQILPLNSRTAAINKRDFTEIYIEENLAEDELIYWLSLISGKENFPIHRFNS